MDTRENKFAEMREGLIREDPSRYIPFDVGEEFVIKGYRFKIARVEVGMNELVLEPVGMADRITSLSEPKKE